MSHSSTPSKNESGQAAVLIAVLLFFVFLGFAALAIDGSMTYQVRRDLQNVADSAALAACRVIANNDTSTTPVAAARNAVNTHLGGLTDFAVGTNPPATNVGSDIDLYKGIEVSSATVRVALQRRVPTVLTQFLGRGDSIMIAQAHCDARGGGGPLPIAVQRYDGGKGRSLRDHIANKAASPTAPTPPNVPYPTDSVTVTLAGRYGPFPVPVPMSQYTASFGGVNDANTGPEICLLGQCARTNNPPNDMNGFIMPDIRNVAGVPEAYNGASGNSNTLKDISALYIFAQGYPGPFPAPGEQMAVLAGVSAAFSVKSVRDSGYQVGDLVPAFVYDGNVWAKPDYVLKFSPRTQYGISTGYPNSKDNGVSYQIDISAGTNKWPTAQSFKLTFWFSEGATVPAGTHINVNGSDLPDYTLSFGNVQEAIGWHGEVLIYSTSAGPGITDTNQYLGGLNLMVESTSSGITKGSSSNYGFGSSPVDYTLTSPSSGGTLRQGTTGTVDLTTFGNSLVPSPQGCKNLTASAEILASGTPQTWSTFFSSANTLSIAIARNKYTTEGLSLVVNSGALPGNYKLRFTLPLNSCGPAHTVEIPLQIVAAANVDAQQFVFIQGYTVFRISYVDSNDVKGYAVSSLYFNYQDVIIGRQPRLIPW